MAGARGAQAGAAPAWAVGMQNAKHAAAIAAGIGPKRRPCAFPPLPVATLIADAHASPFGESKQSELVHIRKEKIKARKAHALLIRPPLNALFRWFLLALDEGEQKVALRQAAAERAIVFHDRQTLGLNAEETR